MADQSPSGKTSTAGTPTPTPTLTSAPTPTGRSLTPTATAAAAETGATGDDLPVEGDTADGDTSVDWQAFVPTDTADHLATMDRAARESGCGVPWQLLAAIARVESDFGRNMATSSAGAIGYGQFLPTSWQAFGNEGNVYDYRAALPAIATYLCHAGLASDPRAALFAYNHADWYVDLVLDLAVRYDRMAPGAPTPDVLDLNPATDAGRPMHYAPGRDLRSQAQARSGEGEATWLGVPWRGRPPRSMNSASTLENTSVAMLRAAFGLSGELPDSGELPQPGQTVHSGLVWTLADRAWAGSLFANPRPLGDTWSIGEIRQGIEQGRSVVAVLDPRLLPGHAAGDAEASGDQPILVIGVTPDGLIYSDPSFSSSLGYGLELSDAEFAAAWQAATPPLQALVISTRPQPPPRDDYFRGLPSRPQVIVAEPTRASLAPVIVGPVVSDSDAKPPDMASTTPWAADLKAPDDDPSASTVDSPSTLSQSQAAVLTVDDNQQPPNVDGRRDEPDRSWLVLAGAAVVLGGLVGLRRRRARQP